MEYWKLLPYHHAPPTASFLDMAGDLLASYDSAIAEADERPIMRWYSCREPALVLGVGQKWDIVDREHCRAAEVMLHKRASGGTAVLIEPDMLMLDIILPKHHRLYLSDVTHSYRWIGEVWNVALCELGVAARLLSVEEARSDTKALDSLTRMSCFAGRSPYEVAVGERKIVGLSQIRRRNGAIIQAGIPMYTRPDHLPRLLALNEQERSTLTMRLHERVVGLAEVCPSLPTVDDTQTPPAFPAHRQVMETFARALRSTQQVVLEEAAE